MRRSQIYTEEQIRDYDHSWAWKDIVAGFGAGISDVLGSTSTLLRGFGATQNVSPNLSIQLASGSIYSESALDGTPFGSLPADATLVYQQGFAAAQTITLQNTLTSGQSQWVLLQCVYEQADAVRATDPNNGVLPYVNTLNILQPLFGPGGTNGEQPTQRDGIASVSEIYGTPALTGSQVAPLPTGSAVPMYLILLQSGQTQITNGEILVAGPSVGTGVANNYPQAPFLAGQTNSHHGGIAGQAPKIQLSNGAEVQGTLPLANMSVSNQNPSQTGGNVTVSGTVPVCTYVDVNPNGALAGNVQDEAFDPATGQMFKCTTAGNSSTTVWTGVGAGGIAQYENTTFTPAPGNYTYEVDTSGGTISINMPTAVSMGSTGVEFINIGPNALTLTCAGGESFVTNYGSVSSITLYNKGDTATFSPRASVGWYTRNAGPQSGVPYGFMGPWLSTDTAPPVGWHLCDGSTVTWQTGPHAGTSVTLPNMIGMLALGSDLQSGSNTANSSGFGHITNQSSNGATTHDHTVTISNTVVTPGSEGGVGISGSYTTSSSSNLPASIGFPWIVKL